MSDTFESRVERAARDFERFCISEQRHRVAWLTGEPRSGKSTLACRLAEQQSWAYLNYTLEPGYFDQLANVIQSYQPETFNAAIREWCQRCNRPVLILDEIDALLAAWTLEQRRTWASSMSRMRELPCGLVLVTSFFDEYALRGFAPDATRPHVYSLPGVTR
ncbi:MAG: hypothetical protein OHK0022_03380 [Roseiflexaceae bacterium]